MCTASASSIVVSRWQSCARSDALRTVQKKPIVATLSPRTSGKAYPLSVPRTCRQIKRCLAQRRETIGLERHIARGAADVGGKSGRIGFGGAGERDRIDDR